MMQIIKHGTELKKKFKCINCGCEFIANKNEYHEFQSHPNEYMYKCECPECSEECVTD